jgi:menaquinone-specific isochorismate synthase
MYGGMRFDPDGMPAGEWRPFGSFYFFVPQLELCECHGCSLLAVNIAWDKALNWTLRASICKALLVLSKVTGGVSWSASHERRTSVVESKHHSPDEGAWTHAVRSVLEVIKDSSHGSPPVVSSRYLPNGSVSETKLLKELFNGIRTFDLDKVFFMYCLVKYEKKAKKIK